MTVAVALGALLVVAAVAALLDGRDGHIAAVAVAGALAVVIFHLRAAGKREAELTEARREAERSARKARDQLEAMLRGVADAVTAQAPDGRLLFANDAAVELLGFESSEALLAAPPGDIMSRFEIFDESGRPYPVEDLPGRRALEGEEGAEAIMRFRIRATGEERWSAVKATPVKNGAAGVSMAINVIEDITAHKRSELAQRFLARSSTVVAGWVDSDELLTRVARLAVPEIADWCAVDLVTNGAALERVAPTGPCLDRVVQAGRGLRHRSLLRSLVGDAGSRRRASSRTSRWARLVPGGRVAQRRPDEVARPCRARDVLDAIV